MRRKHGKVLKAFRHAMPRYSGAAVSCKIYFLFRVRGAAQRYLHVLYSSPSSSRPGVLGGFGDKVVDAVAWPPASRVSSGPVSGSGIRLPALLPRGLGLGATWPPGGGGRWCSYSLGERLGVWSGVPRISL